MFDEVVKGAVEGLVKGLMSDRGKPDGRIVEAEHFVLRDAAKNVRAMLTNLPAGPTLVFLDLNQEIRAILGCDDSGEGAVYLQLDCPDLERRVVVRADESGPRLFLHNEEQEVQAMLHGDPGGGVVLQLNAGDRHTKAALWVDEHGPRLFFHDANGQPRTWLHFTPTGPALVFADDQGRCRAELMLDGDTPTLRVLDESGQVQAQYPATPPT